MKNLPFVSIIIVNYFGEKVIKKTLNSLFNLNYPTDLFEIIVVDNGSKDKSKTILENIKKEKKQFKIKVIYFNKNLGFSKGNNLGIKKAKGKYVVLLNNDCLVDKNWLRELVKVAEGDDRIFSVNSKILLYPRYFFLKLKKIEKINLTEVNLIKSTLLSFFKKRKISLSFQIKNGYYQIEIPLDPYNKKFSIELELKISYISLFNFNYKDIQLFQNDFVELLAIKKIKKEISYKVKINTHKLYEKSFNKIQNAGILVFPDGSGRDIGAIVRYSSQEYEFDLGQFEKVREIYASCGAASLYRREVLDNLGGLGEDYFMYYEDVDISEQARLNGYKIFYNPKAIVRHLHAFSSKEWSPFFIYHAEKGRLLHVFYNFPMIIFLREYLKFNIKAFLKFIYFIFNRKDLGQLQYLKITLYFLFTGPRLIFNKIKRCKKINIRVIKQNYSKLSNGFWLFNC